MLAPRQPFQLFLARELFEDAIHRIAIDTEPSRVQAAITLDLSIDVTLSAVIHDGGMSTGNPRHDRKWHETWTEADRVATREGWALPDQHAMKALHEVRNLAQHNGTVPSTAELARYQDPSRKLHSGVFSTLYGFDFDSFRRWDLVTNEALRKLCIDSEDALRAGKRFSAFAGCWIAFDRIIDALRAHWDPGVTREHSAANLHFPHGGEIANQVQDPLRTAFKVVEARVDGLRDQVIAANLGLPMSQTRRFLTVVRSMGVFEAQSGLLQLTQATREHQTFWARNDVPVEIALALDYLNRLIVRVQDAYPTVLDPVVVKMPLRDQKVWKEESA
jgi:hypothetical protein